EKNYPLFSSFSSLRAVISAVSPSSISPDRSRTETLRCKSSNCSVNSEEQSLTCRELQGAASQRRAELLHHHHAVFVESPLQHGDDSHPCREPVTVQGKCFLHSYETHTKAGVQRKFKWTGYVLRGTTS
uniref:Uncharacterized protein n=1 Tax=Oryzias latipes TaxID=8090 RepID=A0A3B3HI71_ORYLA